jgi:hypothetical protein
MRRGRVVEALGVNLHFGDDINVQSNACYPLFSNSSRPISMRRISLVPAPIS